jgi:hypothetical protein
VLAERTIFLVRSWLSGFSGAFSLFSGALSLFSGALSLISGALSLISGALSLSSLVVMWRLPEAME